MIYILDTETTDLDDPQCIELAYGEVVLANGLLSAGTCTSMRFRPSKPISFGAMSTHHIQPSDLVGCPPYSAAKIPDDAEYLIGHNVDFDWKVLGCPDVRRICTLAMARKIWPDIDSHKLGALAYMLWPEKARQMTQYAHSAAADVNLCYEVLAHMCRMIRPESIEALWQFSENARIPTVMTFGKHKGMAIANVPPDYKRWLLNQPDIDPYLVKALKGDSA